MPVLEIRGRIITAGGDITQGDGPAMVTSLQGTPISAAAPTDGEVLTYIAADAKWEPALPVLVNGA